MASFPNHKKPEHPSTYFVQNRSNKEELQRLQIQDHLLITAMGGLPASGSAGAA